MKNRILVTGANGQLGKSIQEVANKKHPDVTFIYTDITDLDITSQTDLERFFSLSTFDFVINAAAYTAVDKAEEEQEAAFLLNATAVTNLASTCKKHGTFLIHISTDYVFDGTSKTPYSPNAPVNPISVYGKSKLAGENALRNSGCPAVIFRTSWLYSAYGHNFVKSILHHARQKNQIKVVNDQHGAPTFAPDLADALLTYITKKELHQGCDTFHYANEGNITWYDFAVEIVKRKKINCLVTPINSTEYPTIASRPAYSVFDLSKTKQQLGISIPFWSDSLNAALDDIP